MEKFRTKFTLYYFHAYFRDNLCYFFIFMKKNVIPCICKFSRDISTIDKSWIY